MDDLANRSSILLNQDESAINDSLEMYSVDDINITRYIPGEYFGQINAIGQLQITLHVFINYFLDTILSIHSKTSCY